MQCLALLPLASLASTTLAAQATTVFLPSVCAQNDGRAGGAWPGFTQRFQMQILLHEGRLSGLSGRVLTGITVRRDGQYLRAHQGGRASVRIALSAAAVTPNHARPSFNDNRGTNEREVFRGEVVLPDAPALASRNDVTWLAPHAVDFPFATPYPYSGGTLCIEVEGAPVSAATSPWWRVDYDLFTHDAQATVLGSNCDPSAHATASRNSLLPGGTVRLTSVGPMQALGIAMVDGAPLPPPGIDLGFMGAPGCRVHVLPTLMLGASYGAPSLNSYGAANIRLQLPSDGYLLGASLHSQWLAFPNPVNPAQLTTTNALTLQVGTQLPDLGGVVVRTSVVTEPAPLPSVGSVLPHLVPVLCLRAQ